MDVRCDTLWSMIKGSHRGQIGLIIGNGPSLKQIPLKFLKGFYSFGSNRIYLLEDFNPTYYVAVNPLVIEQSLEEIKKINCRYKFISEAYADQIPGALPLKSYYYPFFSLSPNVGIYEGFTVTYVAMQIAVYMGFTILLLIGVDHSYQYDGIPNQEVVSQGDDVNHFHPAYFCQGVRWNLPDLEQAEQAYRLAKEACEWSGVRVINLTPGSKLDVFEKQDWREWCG